MRPEPGDDAAVLDDAFGSDEDEVGKGKGGRQGRIRDGGDGDGVGAKECDGAVR